MFRKMSNMRAISDRAIRDHLKQIFLKSVQSVKPENLIKKHVAVNNSNLVIGGKNYRLEKPCYVVGFGKAVLDMAITLESVLGSNLKHGIVTVPTGIFNEPSRLPLGSRISFIEGAKNNLPDKAAENGAIQIKSLAEKLREDDLLIVLISGGGSALLSLPKPPVTLREKLELVKSLSLKGADIKELNSVRKRLSVLKGGGLARIAYPANVIALILSDIVEDPLDYIASGPTMPNCDADDEAIKIIKKHSLYDNISDSIRNILEKQSKEKFPDDQFGHVNNFIIGNNKIAAQAALEQATILGYQSCVLSTAISGEVKSVSKIYVEIARKVAALINSDNSNAEKLISLVESLKSDLKVSDEVAEKVMQFNFGKGVCFIFGGEPTVVVKGAGKGGRNQQLALDFSVELNKLNLKGVHISFLSCGTDGIDGPTDVAGAFGSSNLVNNAIEQNMDPTSFLLNYDCYSFYSAFNFGENFVRIGHTGTNVMDIHVLIIIPS